MLRRILALFALITGIAAFGAPASASMAEAMQCEIGVSQQVRQSDDTAHLVSENIPALSPRQELEITSFPESRTGWIAPAPVLYGADRAYE